MQNARDLGGGVMTTTAELLALLKRHYVKPGLALPGGIFLPEVGWNGGNGGGCDAIWVGFTSSSGRILVGHELKVSRSDWLSELSKPGKADAWADQCHQWWLVVSDPMIVHEGELPAGWGLMSPGRSRTRMQVHVPAERKPVGHVPSWTAVRSVMARQDTLRAQAIENARADAYRAATAEVNERVEQRIAQELARAASNDELSRVSRERLRALEKALGVSINWGEPGAYYAQVTIPEVEQVRQVLTETRSVKAAVRRMVGAAAGYPIDNLQRAVDTMRDALIGLAEESKENF